MCQFIEPRILSFWPQNELCLSHKPICPQNVLTAPHNCARVRNLMAKWAQIVQCGCNVGAMWVQSAQNGLKTAAMWVQCGCNRPKMAPIGPNCLALDFEFLASKRAVLRLRADLLPKPSNSRSVAQLWLISGPKSELCLAVAHFSRSSWP